MPAPPLVADTGMTPHASDDSDQGLSTPPESASQSPSPPSLSRRGSGHPAQHHSGSQLFIDAPGHPPIPGLVSPMSRSMGDMFAITNALNGLDMNNNNGGSCSGGVGVNSTDGPWMIPGRRGSHSSGSPESTPKKVKSKKSKSSLASSPDGSSSAKRARIVAPPAPSWRSDTGALGGF
ncbi:hypothetical protein M408DRAFT_86483 [Serendipita vermifera MAFF 305830]|uniref:Uncharacterized protein n=1 Tax=Serendipita vermifera MAFF 305830 TaxID=933852 RepID=A0A0C3BAL6_SERVB|nr:hypothetical protein M408DRAFT_86483 [Serendipita vermifera MAFF 305830]